MTTEINYTFQANQRALPEELNDAEHSRGFSEPFLRTHFPALAVFPPQTVSNSVAFLGLGEYFPCWRFFRTKKTGFFFLPQTNFRGRS